ncbi:MAG: UvrD-helicase domain-containing protein, partial [Pseudomonadota bacterium]|nr:UvrD-helicase domain-containing protein [Pseudomonadota bacterium]
MARSAAKVPAAKPQHLASDPGASVWVSANAGTGKTYVLVLRVLRLLLQDGVRPEQILCLTYTKAAAAEMKNRVLKELRKWAVAEEDDLRRMLKEACGEPADDETLARARRLFAQTLDAHGGLKIYTLHAFCERLLHRFPLEADVPPSFRVLDEVETRLLMNAAIDEVLARASDGGASPLSDSLATVIAETGEERFRSLIEAILARRDELRAISRLSTDAGRVGEAEELALRRLMGVGHGRSVADSLRDTAAALTDGEIDAMLPVLAEGQKTDRTLADRLSAARYASDGAERARRMEQAFLTQAGAPRKRICTKAVSDGHPDVDDRLGKAAAFVATLAAERAAMRVAAATGALITLAEAMLDAYSRAKSALAALDFSDLIEKADNLLNRTGAAAWVLYKLDYGIDHILVDESQDTSPAQWRVVSALVQEFFAGAGAREELRTLFAVGDEKQSIYSVQGARPEEVQRKGRDFKSRAEGAGRRWHPVPLTVSYRSVAAILSAVDGVFELPAARPGIAFGPEPIVHEPYRTGQPGLVDVWPVEEPPPVEDAPAFEPNRAGTGRGVSPEEALARRIAATVRNWIDTGEELRPGRHIRAADILILLRQRAPLARPLIRALKDAGVPVAGADRLRLAEHIAVKDMTALGDFVLLPEDDLS